MDSKLNSKQEYLVRCRHDNHDQNKVIAICQNRDCMSRLCCEMCIQQDHKSCWEFLLYLPETKDNKRVWEIITPYITNLKNLETRNYLNFQLLENQFKKLKLRIGLLLESFQQKFNDNLQNQYNISVQPLIDSLKTFLPNESLITHQKNWKEGSFHHEFAASFILNTEIPEKDKSQDICSSKDSHLESFGECKVIYKILADQFKNELLNLTQNTVYSIGSRIYFSCNEKPKTPQESPSTKEKVEMILYNNLRSSMQQLNSIHTSEESWGKDNDHGLSGGKTLNSFFYLSCSSCFKKLLYNNRYICPDCANFVFCQDCFDRVPHEHALIALDSNKIKYLEQWLTSLNQQIKLDMPMHMQCGKNAKYSWQFKYEKLSIQQSFSQKYPYSHIITLLNSQQC